MIAVSPVQGSAGATSFRRERTWVRRGARSSIFDQMVDTLAASAQDSRFVASESVRRGIEEEIKALVRLKPDWASNDAERPNAASIRQSILLLERFQSVDLQPELVLPSAEGGVALDVSGPNGRRALIEVLNTGIAYIVLYDHVSFCKTLMLDQDKARQEEAFIAMSTYIRRGQAAGEHR